MNLHKVRLIADEASAQCRKQFHGTPPAWEWEIEFAKLVVAECASALWSEECNYSDLALEEYKRNSTKIKEYFGV